jgi:hypothetical protein
MSYEYAMSIINAPVTTNFEEDAEIETKGLNPGYDEEDIEELTMTSEEAAKKILAILTGKTTKRRGRPRKEK